MYVFMAVAPCSFNIGGKSYKLAAGSTFSIAKELGEQLRQPTFPFRKHLRLMSQLEQVEAKVEEPKKPEVAQVVEKTEVKPKVEEKIDTNSVKSKRVVRKSEA